jgi:hypothetical protein
VVHKPGSSISPSIRLDVCFSSPALVTQKGLRGSSRHFKNRVMKKKQKAKPAKEKPPKPRLKWQKGAYSRDQQVRIDQPYQFMLLCKLVGVPPMKMLNDFMTNIGGDSFNRTKNGECRSKAADYFIQCGYGQDFYSEPDIRQMLRELDTMGGLWPEGDKWKIIKRHAKWRDYYQDNYWFKKWYRKPRRKL